MNKFEEKHEFKKKGEYNNKLFFFFQDETVLQNLFLKIRKTEELGEKNTKLA